LFQIDLKSRKAIYTQVIDNFKRLIVTGVLKPDEKVPSVRDMSQTLTINPTTVQKAYRELENQGYLYTVLGQGSFISSSPKQSARPEKEIMATYENLRALVQELIFFGESEDTVIDYIKTLYSSINIESNFEGNKGAENGRN